MVIDCIEFDGQCDSLAVTGNEVYITIQSDDLLVHVTNQNGKLIRREDVTGFNFPHGIESRGSKIAVTNYGDNTVRVVN